MEIYHLQTIFNYIPYLTLKTTLWGRNEQYNNQSQFSKETKWLGIMPKVQSQVLTVLRSQTPSSSHYMDMLLLLLSHFSRVRPCATP